MKYLFVGFISSIHLLLIFFLTILHPTTILAADISRQKASQTEAALFYDDFSQDLKNWDIVGGDMSAWNIHEQQLEASLHYTFQESLLKLHDSFWPNDLEGYTLSFTFEPVRGADKNFSFHYDSHQSWSEFHFNNEGLELVTVKNDVTIRSQKINFKLNNGQKYNVKIIMQPSSVQLFIDNKKIASSEISEQIDTPSLVLKVTTGADAPTLVLFDDITITRNIDSSFLSANDIVPLSQKDNRWGETQYDSAEEWTLEPTFSRWGCLVTSLVMVLQAYDIRELPDGRPLNPGSLNEWLLEERDGYLHGGLVNLAAVMRITQASNEKFGTPKLEYSKIINDFDQVITTSLSRKQPFIAEIPGHFFVADALLSSIVSGATTNHRDFSIIDPWYDFNRFSQHQSNLLSVRKFTPSFTDLSYIVISTQSDEQLYLYDSNGVRYASKTEQIIDPKSKLESPSIQVIEIAKPTPGTYFLQFESAAGMDLVGFNEVRIFSYNQKGQVSALQKEVRLNDTSKIPLVVDDNFFIHSQLMSTITEKIANMTAQQHRIPPFVLAELQKIGSYTENSLPEHELRYGALFQSYVEFYSPYIPDEVEALLR